MADARVLIAGLKEYHSSLKRSSKKIGDGFSELKNQWTVLRRCYRGEGAEHLHRNWENTVKEFKEYLSQSHKLAAFLSERIEFLSFFERQESLGGQTSKVASSALNASKSEANYIDFNNTHKDSMPRPKGSGPGGGKLQSHHGLQKEWAMSNLKDYGYDPNLAPSITLETGRGFPHTAISSAQNLRRNARVAAGKERWGSSLQDELQYIVDDFSDAGFSRKTVERVMDQQYKMLNQLGVTYERIDF